LVVRLHLAAMAADVKLDHATLVLTTEPLLARWQDFSFYTSPKDPSVQQVVGELCLSHPVALETLRRRLRMEVIGNTPLFAVGAPGAALFTVAADPESERRFFVRSRPINAPPHEDWVKLTLPAGTPTTFGGSPLAEEVTAKTRVPDKYSGLELSKAEASILRTDEGEPQQFVFVVTSIPIDSAEIASRIGLWWHADGWHDPDGKLVFEQRVASARKVALVPVESEAPLTKRHAFRFVQADSRGGLCLRVESGVKAPGGFETNRRFEKTLGVPQFPKEVRLLGKGNVLAMEGERKLAVQARGIDHLRVTLARVPESQFQHLISLTTGSTFDEPEFRYPFGEDNLVHSWSKVVATPHANDWEAVQAVIDLAEAPPLTAPDQLPGGRGVFFVHLEAVKKLDATPAADDLYSRIDPPADPETDDERHESWHDRDGRPQPDDGFTRCEGATEDRFLLVTDLGLLVKAAADGSRDVFVMSLAAGQAVSDVEIRALARNGGILATAKTDAQGHARLPAFDGFRGERLPVAVLATKAGDTSFLPFNEHQLPAMDYSRFDIEGVLASRLKAVEAFVFTERGVYRPGDTVHVALMTRRRDWQPVLEGLPVRISLSDPRGREVGNHQDRLPYDGFLACDFAVGEGAALGVCQISADVLDRSGHVMFRLGRRAIRVEEFQPDRMKVAVQLDPAPPAGWLPCAATEAKVSVRSLFGEPAPDRRVTMNLELSPADFGFPEWPGFSFYDRFAAASDSRAGRTLERGGTTTDEQGVAEFDLPLDTLKDPSFRLAVLTEAFEREGGRSVRSAFACLVSPHESVIGWKADGDLNSIAKDGSRGLKLVAVGRDLKPVALDGMRRRIIEIRQVSVLTTLPNGNYAYVSTAKEQTIEETPLVLGAGESEWAVPSAKVGRFRMEIIDADNAVHCAVPFQIVGKGDANATLEREAELALQLSKSEVLPGEEIEVHLAAPYCGAGLVTLERDRVIVAQWFKTDTKATTVRVKLPDDAEGTYYVNAAYVRATSAPEVFHSPLSYAAAPLRVIPAKRKLELTLDAPQEVRPGTELKIGVKSNQAARVVVFGVDEGIHQITGYQLPQPLDFFLRKQALEVRTQQWLDLLLPEYRFLKAAPAFGGDGDGESALALHLNPFKRRQEPPVVFWSGIVEVGPQGTEVKWHVPDYFNGNLRVMAVGCQAGKIGAAEAATLIRAPIIVQPNAPLFVAPGDEFETSVAVLNRLAAEGPAKIEVTVAPSEHFEPLGTETASLVIEKGREAIARFRFRAKDQLGGAELRFEAKGGGEAMRRATSLSVRPATHHLTRVVTGWFRTGSTEEAVKRTLYPQFRHAEATASIVPLGLARGLEAYVNEYPYGCSEQITSRAMVKLIAASEADFGLTPQAAAEAVRSAIAQLAGRQRADGGFGYWYADPAAPCEFHSLYVLHFLCEARLLGHTVPEELLRGAANYAAATARAKTTTPAEAELQAYAVYLLARTGSNPAPQLLNLRDTLQAKFPGQWEGRVTAAWMAATYQLLKQDDEANKLLDVCLKARAGGKARVRQDPWDYYRTPMLDDLMVFYVQCRHFPERAKKFGIGDLEPVMKPLREQAFNTLACSYMTLALKAYSDLARGTGVEVSVFGRSRDEAAPKLLAGPGQGILRGSFGPETVALRFERKQKGDGDIGAFYQVVEQGYDRGKPAGPERSGLEVAREIIRLHPGQPLRAGDPVDVVLRVRNVAGKDLTNLALVDLLPAGFEVLAGDLQSGAGTVPGTEFAELREDRNLFFLGLAANAEWSVKYRMKAVCAGTFTVPPALAEDMYDRGLHGVSAPGRIEIAPAQ